MTPGGSMWTQPSPDLSTTTPDNILSAAITAYQRLVSEGWTASDGYIPAQVLYHSTLELLGDHPSITQNEFHVACRVFDPSHLSRFDALRDNVGLVTHLKYVSASPRGPSVSTASSPFSTLGVRPSGPSSTAKWSLGLTNGIL
jgi:hypothetical protein